MGSCRVRVLTRGGSGWSSGVDASALQSRRAHGVEGPRCCRVRVFEVARVRARSPTWAMAQSRVRNARTYPLYDPRAVMGWKACQKVGWDGRLVSPPSVATSLRETEELLTHPPHLRTPLAKRRTERAGTRPGEVSKGGAWGSPTRRTPTGRGPPTSLVSLGVRKVSAEPPGRHAWKWSSSPLLFSLLEGPTILPSRTAAVLKFVHVPLSLLRSCVHPTRRTVLLPRVRPTLHTSNRRTSSGVPVSC